MPDKAALLKLIGLKSFAEIIKACVCLGVCLCMAVCARAEITSIPTGDAALLLVLLSFLTNHLVSLNVTSCFVVTTSIIIMDTSLQIVNDADCCFTMCWFNRVVCIVRDPRC